jgi:hypothetical protein
VNVTRWLAHPGEMVDWFKAKLQEFYTLPARIAATRSRARAVRNLAEQKGATVAVAQLDDITRNLGRIESSHLGMQSRVADLFGKLGALGVKMPGLSGYSFYGEPVTLGVLPAIPVAVIVAGSAIALGIAAIMADYAKQNALLAKVEQGVLTPEEAKSLGAGRPLFGIDLGKVMIPLMLIGGALWFGPRLVRAGR